MDEFEAHVGEEADVKVEMVDASGNATTNYDVAGGIEWSSSHPDVVEVVDEDAEPTDAVVRFLGLLTDEDAFVECSFDGRAGEEENRVTLRSQPIRVVPGEATGGRLTLTMRPVS